MLYGPCPCCDTKVISTKEDRRRAINFKGWSRTTRITTRGLTRLTSCGRCPAAGAAHSWLVADIDHTRAPSSKRAKTEITAEIKAGSSRSARFQPPKAIAPGPGAYNTREDFWREVEGVYPHLKAQIQAVVARKDVDEAHKMDEIQRLVHGLP